MLGSGLDATMKNFIDGELIFGHLAGQFEIGSVVAGAISNVRAKIIDKHNNTLYIMVLPFRLERQFNNVLFKMFER